MPFPDGEAKLYELYHTNSRIEPRDEIGRFIVTHQRMQLIASSFIGYPDRPATQIGPTPLGAVDELLNKRSSTIPFSGILSLERLGNILWRSSRINRADTHGDTIIARRVYPSGGAIYGVELYLGILSVKGLDAGIYHWNVLDETLEFLWPANSETWRSSLPGLPEDDGFPAAVVLLTGTFKKIVGKYGERAYRLALFEAGGIALLLQLMATDEDVPARYIAGYDDLFWDDQLRIDGVTESTLLTVGLG